MTGVSRRRVGALVGLQLLLVAAIFVPSAFTSVTGEEIVLETVPVDPRDLFRGDYVDLRYEISTATVDGDGFERGDGVYVLLAPSGRYHQITSVSHDRPEVPEGHACIQARVSGAEPTGDGQGAGATRLNLEYGLDSYFIPEGTGEPDRDATVDVLVKVDVFCHAVIDTLLVDGEPWP